MLVEVARQNPGGAGPIGGARDLTGQRGVLDAAPDHDHLARLHVGADFRCKARQPFKSILFVHGLDFRCELLFG